MRIELPIIQEPYCGLCTVADLVGNGVKSKILVSTGCYNNYMSEELYKQLEHESPKEPVEIISDAIAYYLCDVDKAKVGKVKALNLPGQTLTDVQVLVTPASPAYQVDMIIGNSIMLNYRWMRVDPDAGFVILSDEPLN